MRPGFDAVGTQDEGLSSLAHHVHAEFSVHVRQSVIGEHSSASHQHQLSDSIGVGTHRGTRRTSHRRHRGR